MEEPLAGIGLISTKDNPLKALIDGKECDFTVYIDKDGKVSSASTTSEYDGVCNVYTYPDAGKSAIHLDYSGDDYPACKANEGSDDPYLIYILSKADGVKIYKIDNYHLSIYNSPKVLLGSTIKDQFMSFRVDLKYCQQTQDDAGRIHKVNCRLGVEKDGKKCSFEYTLDMDLGVIGLVGDPMLKQGTIKVYEGDCSVTEAFPARQNDGAHTEKIGFEVAFPQKPCSEL